MRWKGRRGSQNIEDRRRSGAGKAAGPIGGIGLLAVLAIGYFLGVDVTPLLQGTLPGDSAQPVALTQADTEAGQFVSVTLADTEEVWQAVFRDQLGRAYTPVTLVLFAGVTQSRCGGASGATGPFYCPADKKAYLDTAFFRTLSTRLGAKGDFAAAYVVAHEVAHHVQDLLGILGQANKIRQQVSETESNAISVQLELQADCFSGVWAHQASALFGTLERGDLNEAINAARQIGDDTLMTRAGGVAQPHTFTHGTSEQRARWFETGYRSGEVAQCDTFSAKRL
jgi:hypothetical protein